jgi:hypothetical protein
MRIIGGIALALCLFVGFMVTWLGLGLVATSGGPAWVMAGIGAGIMWLSASKLRSLIRHR